MAEAIDARRNADGTVRLLTDDEFRDHPFRATTSRPRVKRVLRRSEQERLLAEIQERQRALASLANLGTEDRARIRDRTARSDW